MAIFEEQVLEPFVARGIGNSGVASRQIQATNLPSLSAAVRESSATQDIIRQQRINAIKAQSLVDRTNRNSNVSISSASSTPSFKPFIIGKRAGTLGPDQVTYVTKGDRGDYKVNIAQSGSPFFSSQYGAMDNLKTLGLNPDANYPSLTGALSTNRRYTKEGLTDALVKAYRPNSGSSISLSNLLNKLN